MTNTLKTRHYRVDAASPTIEPKRPQPKTATIEFIPSESYSELDRQFVERSIGELCAHRPVSRMTQPVSLRKVAVGLSTYLAELQRTPLLDAESEYVLFRWMNYLKYRAAGLVTEDSASDRRRLLRTARKFRNQIVAANLRLVVSIAKKHVDTYNTLEELISEGNLPLMRAVEIFDFERGNKFSTYATWAIRNGLNRSIPRNRRRMAFAITGVDDVLPDVVDVRSEQRGRESYRTELRDTVERLLSKLSERDRQIVTSRFGLNQDDREYRFREIADSLGVSTERVRQLLARTLRELHESSHDLALEFV